MRVLNKITVCFLLVTYLFANFRYVVPEIADIFAHTFWKSQHMAAMHFENGKWHVHLQMEAIAKDSDKKSNPATNQNNTETLWFHIPVKENLKFEQIPFHIPSGFFHLCELHSGFLKLVVPPPKAQRNYL